MKDLMKAKEDICRTAELLFRVGLLSLSGGNISCRFGDIMLITPKYSARDYHWRLSAGQICEVPISQEGAKALGGASREWRVHFAVLRHFAKIEAIIHTHERCLLAYALAGKPLPLFGEVVGILGKVVPVSAEAPSGTKKLAQAVVEALLESFPKDSENLAVLVPRHGILLGSYSLNSASSILCAVSECAYARLGAFRITLAEEKVRGG